MKPFQLFQKPMLLLSFLLVYAFSFSQVTEQWVKRYNGPGHGNDRATKLVADAFGNVYVTGVSNGDYTTIKYDAAGNQLWVKRYNGPGNDYDQPSALAVDASGNVYVTGTSIDSNINRDYATVKYDAAGNELWVKRYNGTINGYDAAYSLAVDASGNVYVTGSSVGSVGNSFQEAYTTIKYDAAGNELWVKRSNSGNVARSLALDASGNVYVTGNSVRSVGDEDSEVDYTTIKYDTAGNELWVKRHNGSQNSYDNATSLAVDDSGNVYVAGLTAIIKYDATGNELWVKSGTVASLTVDASGNAYVTGKSYNSDFTTDYATVKYDANGSELWVKRYNGPENGYDDASSLAVDASGNVYVTGSSGLYGNLDYATIKYNANGAQLWVKRYNSSGNGNDYATSLAVDATGNVYVTGGGDPIGYETDYVTIKHNADGSERWIKRYSGPGNLYDAASSLAVDASGNVYVTGRSYSSETYIDYATIKYDASGNELWVKRYNGPGNGEDYVHSLAVDASGNVYVTGQSDGDGTGADYATIKYSQTEAGAVSSFTLINANNGEAIQELKDGDTLNLAALPSLNLNIRANTNPAAVRSVVFSLNGAEIRDHTENIVPYALFADNNKGDYYSWTPTNGNYTLTATPYSAAKGKGEKGTSLSIHFTVTGTAISSLILVNAETDKDIKTLQNGDVIDLAALPTTKLNIRAVVHPDTVGSVVFNLNNRVIVRENYAPYAIGGDIKGDYRAWTLPTGQHNLTATPYDGKYGKGKKGKAHSVTFTVVDRSATTRAANAQQKPIVDAPYVVGQRLSATPNPFTGQTTTSFSVPKSGYTTLRVYDMRGVVVEHLYQAWTKAGKVYNVSFNSKQLPNGVYMLRLITGKHTQSYKLVMIR